MANKLNIAELLKDCPKGMELDCTMYDGVTLDEVSNGSDYPIQITTKNGFSTRLTEYGQNVGIEEAKCVIFPKGKTTWEGFHRPFKDGDIVYTRCDGNEYIFIFENITKNTRVNSYLHLKGDDLRIMKVWMTNCDDKYLRFATEEEKQKLFQAIKDNGYKWNEETKTLEKLVEPKFHEGEWLCVNKPNDYAHLVKIIKVVEVFGKKRYVVSRDYDFDLDVVECDFIEKNYHLWTIKDAKDGDVLFHSDSASNGIFIFKEILQRGTIQKVTCYCDYDSEDGFCLGENHTCCWTDSKILHPATKEQCALLFRMMKKAGYEWNEKTKTLKKVEPKFKVGDRIRQKGENSTYTITDVNDAHYFCGKYVICNTCDNDWELDIENFDIDSLMPFEKVLVRDSKEQIWLPSLWVRKSDNWYITTSYCSASPIFSNFPIISRFCPFEWHRFCIPYNNNEHLLGTSDDCDDIYITW